MRTTLPTHASTARLLAGFSLLVSPFAAAGISYDENNDAFHRLIGESEDGVAYIEIFGTGGSLGFGSAALIGDRYLLTAAHVVADASDLRVSFGNSVGTPGFGSNPNALSYSVKDWFVPTDYSYRTGFGLGDVALIRLNEDASEKLDRYGLYEGDPVGQKFKQVGYGVTGDPNFGFLFADGVRRGGFNKVSDSFSTGNQLITYDLDFNPSDENADFGQEFRYNLENGVPFDEDGRLGLNDYRIPLEWLPTGGDSGSPLLIGKKIAGVVSYGERGPTLKSEGGALRVDAYRDFIDGIKGSLGDSDDLSDGQLRSDFGAFRGSKGNPIGFQAFAGLDRDDTPFDIFGLPVTLTGDALASAQQRFARLVSIYSDPLVSGQMSVSELIELYGADPSLSTAEAGEALGLGSAASEDAVKAALRNRLDEVLPGNIGRIANAQNDGRANNAGGLYGFLTRFDSSLYEERDGVLVQIGAGDDFELPEGAGTDNYARPPLGDLDLSRVTDVDDADEFVFAVAVAAGLTTRTIGANGEGAGTGLEDILGDFDDDGVIGYGDIAGFAAATGLSADVLRARVDAFAAVPEPTTALLLGAGALVLGRRRRNG